MLISVLLSYMSPLGRVLVGFWGDIFLGLALSLYSERVEESSIIFWFLWVACSSLIVDLSKAVNPLQIVHWYDWDKPVFTSGGVDFSFCWRANVTDAQARHGSCWHVNRSSVFLYWLQTGHLSISSILLKLISWDCKTDMRASFISFRISHIVYLSEHILS